MSTTRHHINRQRRRQAREIRPAAPAPGSRTGPTDASDDTGTATTRTAGLAVLPPRAPAPRPARGSRPATADDTTTEKAAEAGAGAGVTAEKAAGPAKRPTRSRRPSRGSRPSRPVVLALLCLLTLVLGGFAGWAHARAESLRDRPAVRNTALTDAARTSEIKTQTEKAVAALFSYDHAHPDAYDKATKTLLTGKAVAQHRALLDAVRTRADQQKAVITTTVTDSAVERVDGDRARVLVYADQSSVSTAGGQAKQQAQDQGTYAGAMFAVDVVRQGGHWLVSGIDTFGR
ncbi:hypothetical protein ABZ858_12650 [Streptomyces sp. NPDC047017]|uniref:hypothetical protein n=1 Tax=Streptomyces sp. NPDC047017 TaxID=3155024 RepID=UPI0033CF8B35